MGCCTSRDVCILEVSYKPRDSIPPIKPTKRKKKNSVPRPETFVDIDEHALKVPVSVQSSVATLAKNLVKPTRNDMEKVRAIYIWITENISYDTAGFFSGNKGPQTTGAVIHRGTAVCEGYSTLFKALCSEIGIPCKKVSGFAKGFGYDPEKAFPQTSMAQHVWNVVFINGEWRPVDSTWGAGHLNANKKFQKCFEEFYFLTDPEDFVLEHFPFVEDDLPKSRTLQLLKKPISLDTFNTAICPTSEGIEWGFESNHRNQVIMLKRKCNITFRTRYVDLESASGHLIESNTGKDCTNYMLISKCGDRFIAKITPPFKGVYKLELFGKPAGETECTHPMLISYVVRYV